MPAASASSIARPRVLLVITLAEQGGAQSHVETLLRGLNECFDLHLCHGGEGYLSEVAAQLGIPVYRAAALQQPLSMAADIKAFTQLIRVIDCIRPDLVHAHSSKAGLLSRAAARWLRVPCVFTAHGWAFTEGAPWLQRTIGIIAEWLIGRLGHPVIAVSAYDSWLATRGRVLPSGRIRVVRNAIPEDTHRSEPGRQSPVRIVMVARFAHPKDHLSVLRALSRCQDSDWELLFAGDGPLLRRAQEEAETLSISGRVRFLGARSDVPQVLSDCQIFILMSNYEGLPISIIEAMRAGLPVIASDVGGVSELVEDGVTGFLVPPRDVCALKMQVDALLQRPDLRLLFGNQARAKYERQFRVDRMLDEISTAYRDILSGSDTGRALQGNQLREPKSLSTETQGSVS